MSKDFSNIIGQTLKPGTFKIRAKKLVAFANSIKVKQPDYLEDEPIAHPSYANAYVAPAIRSIFEAKNPDGSLIITNPLKILHGGQVYKFPKGTPPIKDGDELKSTPAIKSMEIKRNGMLLITIEASTVVTASKDESKVGKEVCITEIGIVVMPGGFEVK
ncbi:MAG: MaoC family dehydratase N-terminal domain-containing protein [Candidatus Helarchaeota archaeon]|nr:MaoC family dehydratase N-terminal domain-containing protein [Candidatus Helarchaeota archaeon]